MNYKTVVFSWTGNTAACAVALEQESGIEPFLLLEENERAGNKGFALGGLQASLNMRTRLKSLPELSGVDVLILCMPVWAGTTPPAINEFFKLCDISGKRVYAIVTQMSTDVPKKLESKLRKLTSAGGGNFEHMFVLSVPRATQLNVEAVLPRAKKWAARIMETNEL